ncbi:unnamed protein product, partial [Porites lobata]
HGRLGSLQKVSYNQLQKCRDTPTKKRPFLLQMAAGHSIFDKWWRGHHKDKIMDRPFIPKCGAVSQVLLQLVVATLSSSRSCTQFLRPPYWCAYTRSRISLVSAEAGAKKAERHKKRRLTVPKLPLQYDLDTPVW